MSGLYMPEEFLRKTAILTEISSEKIGIWYGLPLGTKITLKLVILSKIIFHIFLKLEIWSYRYDKYVFEIHFQKQWRM